VLKEASAEEWTARLRPLGVPVGPVADLDAVLDGELVRARGMVVSVDTDDGPLRMVGNPIHVVGRQAEVHAPPRLHEHTDAVLKRRS
jgi:crotonobetainyl-CoA:carnitine CoA-transferase CaiB-like acyl-CoA transferase